LIISYLYPHPSVSTCSGTAESRTSDLLVTSQSISEYNQSFYHSLTYWVLWQFFDSSVFLVLRRHRVLWLVQLSNVWQRRDCAVLYCCIETRRDKRSSNSDRCWWWHSDSARY